MENRIEITTVQRGSGIKRVVAKLATMRKAQDFIVYPYKLGQTKLMVQSDKAIGLFEIATGEGVLNYKGSNSKYGVHLNEMLGAEKYKFPGEFVVACLEAQPGSGDRIGAHCFIA